MFDPKILTLLATGALLILNGLIAHTANLRASRSIEKVDDTQDIDPRQP